MALTDSVAVTRLSIPSTGRCSFSTQPAHTSNIQQDSIQNDDLQYAEEHNSKPNVEHNAPRQITAARHSMKNSGQRNEQQNSQNTQQQDEHINSTTTIV